MKDFFLYAFFSALYGVLALYFFPSVSVTSVTVEWGQFARLFITFAVVLVVARWSVIAFHPKLSLLKGQTIVGIEEPQGDKVLDIIDPVLLTKEDKKPKLRKEKR